LVCLAHLCGHDKEAWAQLTRLVPATGDPGTARKVLRQVTRIVDSSLGHAGLLGDSTAPPARLRPVAFEPVRDVIELIPGLTAEDVARLRLDFLRDIRGRDDRIYTPSSIARVMVRLVNGAEAYDPYARFGELLAEFARVHRDVTVKVLAENSYPTELRLAGIWLAQTGAQIALSTASKPGSERPAILLNPPFGKHGEFNWLEQAIKSLTEDGRAAVLMPYSAGFDAAARAHNVRRDLVERGALLAVVGLPARMFPRTSIGVCVWLLRRPTGHAAPVRFVDATRMGRIRDAPGREVHILERRDVDAIVQAVTVAEDTEIGATASPEAIRQNGYSVHPPEYLERASADESSKAACAVLNDLFAGLEAPRYTAGSDEGWAKRPLRELCDIRPGVPHTSLKAAISRAPATIAAVPVVCPRHLRDGQICAENADLADVTLQDRYRLIAGDVLWIRTGAMGGVAMVRPEEAGWLPHTNLLRLRILQPAELSPAYLVSYLAQIAVRERIRQRSIQSVTTSLSSKKLGDFEIPIPPMAHQRRILATLDGLDRQAKAIENRLIALRKAKVQLARRLAEGTVVLTGRGTA
jgi:type I restriction enzyme M protein